MRQLNQISSSIPAAVDANTLATIMHITNNPGSFFANKAAQFGPWLSFGYYVGSYGLFSGSGQWASLYYAAKQIGPMSAACLWNFFSNITGQSPAFNLLLLTTMVGIEQFIHTPRSPASDEQNNTVPRDQYSKVYLEMVIADETNLMTQQAEQLELLSIRHKSSRLFAEQAAKPMPEANSQSNGHPVLPPNLHSLFSNPEFQREMQKAQDQMRSNPDFAAFMQDTQNQMLQQATASGRTQEQFANDLLEQHARHAGQTPQELASQLFSNLMPR